MTHVLLVEDDEGIRASVRLALESEGYSVGEVGSTEEALPAIAATTPDVVLIDVMLPGRDGFECCRLIRRGSDVPIIMVTARADSHDVVAGLEAGADDYVAKPFVMKELSARIRASLRRAHPRPTSEPIVVGDLEIRPDEGVVRRGVVPIVLTKTEFRLLCEMAAAPGRVFSRESLLESVWGYGYFGDARLVDVHVGRLRAKVEPDPRQPRYVLTVRGLGYKVAP